jgi:hypothetical protein
VRITSTVAEYQKLAGIEDQASRLRAWTDEYEAAHRDVFDVYYRSYSDPGRRFDAVADVARISPLVREREARAEALARQAEQEFRARGLLEEIDVVLLVGNRTANGWVAEFHGRQCLFAPGCQAGTLPSRSGYWLADLLARHRLSQHSLLDVLRWDYAEAIGRASSYLRARLK